MDQVVHYLSDKAHYTAEACIIWCFDDRFSHLLEAFLAKENFEHIDLVKVAGGVKDITSPDAGTKQEYLMDQIEKSIKLHHTPRIILMAHSECGAYGGLEDTNFYSKELQKGKDIILQKYPNLSMDIYFADFEGLSRI